MGDGAMMWAWDSCGFSSSSCICSARRQFGCDSNAEPPLAPEIPVDATSRRHRARDMLAELLFEGGAPRHQLEAETIVDHGESAGGQGDPLPIGPGDLLAFGGRMMRESSLSREFGDRIVQLAPTQSVQEIAGEDDSLT